MMKLSKIHPKLNLFMIMIPAIDIMYELGGMNQEKR